MTDPTTGRQEDTLEDYGTSDQVSGASDKEQSEGAAESAESSARRADDVVSNPEDTFSGSDANKRTGMATSGSGAAEDVTPGGPEGSADDTTSGEVPATDVGVGATTTAEPNTFEPEEDPDAVIGPS